MSRHKRVPGEHRGRPTSRKAYVPKRGRKALVAAAVATALAAGPAGAYTIKRGDTLSEIARKHDTTVRKLARINGIKNPNVIYAGDRIRIRAGKGKRARVRSNRVSRSGVRPPIRLGPIPAAGGWSWHTGYPNPAVDISVPGDGDCGAPVRSSRTGTARTYYWGYSYGLHVRIADTLYGHLSDIDVANGQRVARGQQIGNIGSTGNSTGCHLHYEYGR